MNTHIMRCMEMEEKTEMTESNVKAILQEMADIIGEKQGLNITVVKVKKKSKEEKKSA